MSGKRRKSRDAKEASLKKRGALNKKAEAVTDPAFQNDHFFDPRDLVQVKYEMIRRVKKEGLEVTEAAKAFGVSRPTFYLAKEALQKEGLGGLVPKKSGPQHRHKVTSAVVKFIQEKKKEKRSIRTKELLELVKRRFGLTIHRRTMDRVLDHLKKKRN